MRAALAVVALVVIGLAVAVQEAPAYCGYCTPSCRRGNYSECAQYCEARAGRGAAAQATTCFCFEAPAVCAWVMRELGPDGAVYVQNHVAPNLQSEQGGNTRWVACDGAILGREYAGASLDAAYDRTARIVI